MTSREALAVSILALFLLRWAEYWILRRPGPKEGVKSRANTALTLLFGSLVWIVAILEARFRESDPIWWLSGAGAVLYAFRLALKAVSVRTLGGAWSTEIEIRANHRLVREGPYRWIRHPIYLCNLLEPVAVAMCANGWIAGTMGALLMWPTLYCRLRKEEALLLETFGEAYETYRREVPALLPWPHGGRRVPTHAVRQ